MRPGTWLTRHLSVAASVALISSSQYTASWWFVALCSFAGLNFVATPKCRAAMKIDGGLTQEPLRVSQERCHLCVCGVRGLGCWGFVCWLPDLQAKKRKEAVLQRGLTIKFSLSRPIFLFCLLCVSQDYRRTTRGAYVWGIFFGVFGWLKQRVMSVKK